MLIIVIYVHVLFVEYMLQKCSRVRVFCLSGFRSIIFQTQKLDITMLYSSTITDTADEVLSTKK